MQHASRVPVGLKLAYTVYMAVLIPVYWHYYGPTNFLYFCDVALILTLIAIWREDALLVSMCSVGIVLPQMVWVADFLGHAAGYSLTGMTDYMFDATHSLFLRSLSLFHGWLPFLLIYLVWNIGYDRRALVCWTGLAWALLLICFFLMPPPTPDAGLTPVNINYVWGMSDSAAQSWVPPYVWFAGLLIGLPLLVYAPTHFALAQVMPVTELGKLAHAHEWKFVTAVVPANRSGSTNWKPPTNARPSRRVSTLEQDLSGQLEADRTGGSKGAVD